MTSLLVLDVHPHTVFVDDNEYAVLAQAMPQTIKLLLVGFKGIYCFKVVCSLKPTIDSSTERYRLDLKVLIHFAFNILTKGLISRSLSYPGCPIFCILELSLICKYVSMRKNRFNVITLAT